MAFYSLLSSAYTITEGNPSKIPWFWIMAIAGVLMLASGLYFLRLTFTIPSSGIVIADHTSFIYAPEAGLLKQIHVRVGQSVMEGQALYEIQDIDLDLKMVEMSRQCLQAKSSLEILELARKEISIRPEQADMMNAKDKLERLNRIHQLQKESMETLSLLSKEQLVTKDQYNRESVAMMKTEMERLETTLRASWEDAGLWDLQIKRIDAQIARNKETLNLFEAEYQLLTEKKEMLIIKSPIAGQIVKMEAKHPGMAIDKGSLLAKVSLVNGALKVVSMVPEKNVDLLKIGTRARMSSNVFDSIVEGHIYGKVEAITPDSTSEIKAEPQYEVEISIDSMPYPLVLGSSVRVDFLIARETLVNLMLQRSSNRQALTQRQPSLRESP